MTISFFFLIYKMENIKIWKQVMCINSGGDVVDFDIVDCMLFFIFFYFLDVYLVFSDQYVNGFIKLGGIEID